MPPWEQLLALAAQLLLPDSLAAVVMAAKFQARQQSRTTVATQQTAAVAVVLQRYRRQILQLLAQLAEQVQQIAEPAAVAVEVLAKWERQRLPLQAEQVATVAAA